jgi:signal peptidase I
MTTRTWGALAALLVLSLVSPSLAAWVVRPVKVTGGSMRPTLHGGAGQPSDFIFVDRISYRVSAPRRGDLVVFFTRGLPSLPEDGILVKRIIGLPGERVEFRDGAVFAGGRRLTARDGLAPIRYHSAGGGPKAQPSESGSYAGDTDGYFVVGDNSANSLDSRRWGCVPRKNVYGKVTGIYYPFSRAGRPRYPGAADDFPKRDPGLPETR